MTERGIAAPAELANTFPGASTRGMISARRLDAQNSIESGATAVSGTLLTCAGRPSDATPSGTAYSGYVQPSAARQNAGSTGFVTHDPAKLALSIFRRKRRPLSRFGARHALAHLFADRHRALVR